MKNVDILIVGGGVVGSACAYYLKKTGFSGSIGIVEKDTSYQDGCTARSAGGIRQQFSTPENIELSKFGLALIRNLKAEFGPEADVNFREQGYLILASEDGLPILEENHHIQIAQGADNAILKGDELSARFPWLVVDGIAAGCFGLSGEGWIDPYSLMSLLRQAAVSQGVEVIPGEVMAINRQEDRVTGVTLATGEAIGCGILVNAAGTGAGALAAMTVLARRHVGRRRRVFVWGVVVGMFHSEIHTRIGMIT